MLRKANITKPEFFFTRAWNDDEKFLVQAIGASYFRSEEVNFWRMDVDIIEIPERDGAAIARKGEGKWKGDKAGPDTFGSVSSVVT